MGKWWLIISRFRMMWVILGVVSIAKPYLRSGFFGCQSMIPSGSGAAPIACVLCKSRSIQGNGEKERSREGHLHVGTPRNSMKFLHIWYHLFGPKNWMVHDGTTKNRLESVIPNVLYTDLYPPFLEDSPFSHVNFRSQCEILKGQRQFETITDTQVRVFYT